MVPTAFDEDNFVLDPPPGCTPDQCTTLSVHRGKLQDGRPVVVSCWKVTREELAEIQRTGRIWILVQGTTMPPISPTGFYPWPAPSEDSDD